VTPVLLDTSVIVACLDRSEKFHEQCVTALSKLRSPLVTCEAVIAESCYLLRRMRGAPEAVAANVAAGVFRIPFSLAESARHLGRLLRKYEDHEIDLADACLIQLATELGTGDILTLDSDFQQYRWGRNRPFELMIAIG
jgi:uncharacterized protein